MTDCQDTDCYYCELAPDMTVWFRQDGNDVPMRAADAHLWDTNE